MDSDVDLAGERRNPLLLYTHIMSGGIAQVDHDKLYWP